MDYQIVPMTASHLNQVAELEKICFPEDPWSWRVLEDSLANENAAAFIAQSPDGNVLGYLFFSAVLDEGGVDNLAVSPAARRRGIGRALMEAFHRRAGEKGLAFLFLEVRPSTKSAVSLYESFGYQAAGRRKNYYDNPKEDAIIMRLELTPCS